MLTLSLHENKSLQYVNVNVNVTSMNKGAYNYINMKFLLIATTLNVFLAVA